MNTTIEKNQPINHEVKVGEYFRYMDSSDGIYLRIRDDYGKFVGISIDDKGCGKGVPSLVTCQRIVPVELKYPEKAVEFIDKSIFVKNNVEFPKYFKSADNDSFCVIFVDENTGYWMDGSVRRVSCKEISKMVNYISITEKQYNEIFLKGWPRYYMLSPYYNNHKYVGHFECKSENNVIYHSTSGNCFRHSALESQIKTTYKKRLSAAEINKLTNNHEK